MRGAFIPALLLCTGRKRSGSGVRCLVTRLLTLLALSLTVSPAAAQPCLPDGDVNQNHAITPADARLAFQHFLGSAAPPLTICQQVSANVNAPEVNRITPADALCIFRTFLGLPSCLDTLVLSNAAPLAADDQRTCSGGCTGRIDVLSNDTDPDGDALFVAEVTQGVRSTITITSDSDAVLRTNPLTIRLIPVAGNNQFGQPGQELAAPLVVRMESQFGEPVEGRAGEPVEGRAVTAQITSGEGVFVFMTQESRLRTEVTDAQGEVRFALRVDDTAAENIRIGISSSAVGSATSDTFTYTVCDHGTPMLCATARVTVTARQGTQSPLLVPQARLTMLQKLVGIFRSPSPCGPTTTMPALWLQSPSPATAWWRSTRTIH